MPPTTPPIEALDLTLHIGTGKAGSSSIQAFMRQNRERLSHLGLLYPRTPGQARHGRLSLFVKTDAEIEAAPHWPRQKESTPEEFRRVFRRKLFGEIRRSGLSRVLLSDEELFGSSEAVLQRLRRFTDRIARQVRIVVYLRRQDEHMVSRYQQGVKIGWVAPLRQWAREDMSDLYDYEARLHRVQHLLAPGRLVVRQFDPRCFAEGSLFQDFLDAAGLDARAEDLEAVEDRNLSLDAESVEFLRLLNLHRVEHHGGRVGMIDNRSIVSRLTAASTGPTLTLPSHDLDDFMAQWEASNRRVATDLVGDPAGRLFWTGRRLTGTTTHQHLDPDRVEHFADVAELAEELRGPLRRLAEREATRT